MKIVTMEKKKRKQIRFPIFFIHNMFSYIFFFLILGACFYDCHVFFNNAACNSNNVIINPYNNYAK